MRNKSTFLTKFIFTVKVDKDNSNNHSVVLDKYARCRPVSSKLITKASSVANIWNSSVFNSDKWLPFYINYFLFVIQQANSIAAVKINIQLMQSYNPQNLYHFLYYLIRCYICICSIYLVETIQMSFLLILNVILL